MAASLQTTSSTAFSWMKSIILIQILQQFVPEDLIDNEPA